MPLVKIFLILVMFYTLPLFARINLLDFIISNLLHKFKFHIHSKKKKKNLHFWEHNSVTTTKLQTSKYSVYRSVRTLWWDCILPRSLLKGLPNRKNTLITSFVLILLEMIIDCLHDCRIDLGKFRSSSKWSWEFKMEYTLKTMINYLSIARFTKK